MKATDLDDTTLRYWINQMIYLEAVLISVSHWLFSLSYFSLTLHFPLIAQVIRGSSAVEKRLDRIRCLTWSFNIGFYSLTAINYMLWLCDVKNDGTWYLIETLEKLISAILLIYSVQSLKRQIRSLNDEAIMGREHLIAIHTTLFSLVIVFVICQRVINKYLLEAETAEQFCNLELAFFWFNGAEIFVSDAIFILLIFMSVKFMKPLPPGLRDFLLSS